MPTALTSTRPFIRQTELGTTIRWQTGKIAIADDSARQTFIFLGGVGYRSEPQTDGFRLLVGDDEVVAFDVTRTTTTWQSDDGSVRLHYAPTWTSDQDSAGFFLVEVANDRLEANQACRLAVRSRGANSQRWFAVDPVTEVKKAAEIWTRAVRGR